MALDVYVMPIWRFKVGDFCSPVEAAFGIRPTIITANGVAEQSVRIGWWQRWRARWEVRSIRKAVEAANRTRVRWDDNGDVVYSSQGAQFEALRAFAKWLDCRDRMPEFTAPPDGDYYKHPVWTIEVSDLSSPHLVKHDCYSGYFLPCEFEHLTSVEPYLIFGRWPAYRYVGSSPRLLRELQALQSKLHLSDDGDVSAADPLFAVKDAYRQLRMMAELSCRHHLPIIFYG